MSVLNSAASSSAFLQDVVLRRPSKGDGLGKPEFYPYSTDVLSLAKPSKVEEVKQGDKTLFGIELEFTHSGATLQELSPLLRVGVFKYDSSVDGEFVTFPYTISDMVSKLKELAPCLDTLLGCNGKDQVGVGMHVHVSRKAFPEQVWKNLAAYIYANEEEISKLAGRPANRWCRYRFKNDRYTAVNLENRNTVEFRMFKSPSEAQGVLDNLALVKSWLDMAYSYADYSPSYEWDWEEDYSPCWEEDDDSSYADPDEEYVVGGVVTVDDPDEGYGVAIDLPLQEGIVVANHIAQGWAIAWVIPGLYQFRNFGGDDRCVWRDSLGIIECTLIRSSGMGPNGLQWQALSIGGTYRWLSSRSGERIAWSSSTANFEEHYTLPYM